MKNELLRRLGVLEEKKMPQINAMMLRGGMQERLHRQEIIKFRNDIQKGKKKIRKRLDSIAEKEKENMIQEELGLNPIHSQLVEPLGDFHEPIMRRLRSKRGFF